MTEIVFLYLVAINMIAFCAFGLDKYFAVKEMWRIKEATLLSLCLIGGAFGGYLSMHMFHHKTRKQKFTVIVPIVLALQIFLVYQYLGI